MAILRTQLDGFRLTTAEILYHMPDHPGLLQSFVWQEYDQAPDFPQLHKFLDFWRREIEALVHSVKVAHARVITPGEMPHLDAEFSLH